MAANTAGAPRTPVRPVTLALGGLVVVAMIGVAVLFYRAFGQGSGVQFGIRAYTVSSDRQVQIVFDVAKDPSRTAECTVVARDRSGASAGTAQVRVGPSAGRTSTITYDLATTARAVDGDVTACALLPAG